MSSKNNLLGVVHLTQAEDSTDAHSSLLLAADRFIPGTRSFWQATMALTIASLITFANIHLAQPLLPTLSEYFQVSPTMSSLSVSLNIFSLGIGLFFFGPLSDTFGRKPIMLWTMGLSVVPTLLIPFVDDFILLLIFRMIQGFLLAGLPSVAMAYLGEEFSPTALGLAVGLYISGNTIGGMGGRILSGFMADLFSWRASFIAFGLLGIAAVIAFYYLLPPSKHFNAKPLHIKQSVWKMAVHFRNPGFLQVYLIAFLLMFSFFGVYNYITFLLSGKPYELSTAMLGWLFLTYLAGTFSSTASGRVLDRVGAHITIIAGVLITAFGLLVMLAPSLWLIIAGLIIFCFGFFAAHTSASTWVNQHAKEARASATSLYLIFYYTGGSIGSTGLGFLWRPWGWYGIVLGASAAILLAILLAINVGKNEKKKIES
jgi:YNFM family putative membrane transporter